MCTSAHEHCVLPRVGMHCPTSRVLAIIMPFNIVVSYHIESQHAVLHYNVFATLDLGTFDLCCRANSCFLCGLLEVADDVYIYIYMYICIYVSIQSCVVEMGECFHGSGREAHSYLWA